MSSYFHSASQSCPILSANCRYNLRLFRLFRGDSSGMDKSSSAKCLLYSDVVKQLRPQGFSLKNWVGRPTHFWGKSPGDEVGCERGAKSHVAKKISGRGRRRSRDEKGNHGVGDFRFTNISQLFSIYFFFNYFTLSYFFLYFFNPWHLPTPTPTTYDLYPLPTTHDI